MGRLGRLFTRRRPPRTPTPLILMYHRIAAPIVDPWELSVHPDRFAEQMRMLRQLRRPLPLREFVAHFSRGTLPADAVAVTFDDGYVDNLREAKTTLVREGIPATLFLATGTVGQPVEYWWDELARAILEHPVPADIELDLSTVRTRVRFGLPEAGDRQPWRAEDRPATARQSAYVEVWGRMRECPVSLRSDALARLREALGVSAPHHRDLPMNASEIGELQRGGLFDIGGHSVTHRPLPVLDSDERRREILDSKRECERLASKPVVGFAYPHGALDEATRADVEACGFAWAVATGQRAVSPKDGRFALPRVHVRNDSTEAFERLLAG